MSTSKMFLAGVAGIAAGIAIGVLFAPAKGSKTRKRLKKKIMSVADMYQEELLSSIDDIRSSAANEEEALMEEEAINQQT